MQPVRDLKNRQHKEVCSAIHDLKFVHSIRIVHLFYTHNAPSFLRFGAFFFFVTLTNQPVPHHDSQRTP
jgi:hypothetical protein